MRLRSAAVALLLGLAAGATALADPCSNFFSGGVQQPYGAAPNVPIAASIGTQRMFPCSNQGAAPQSIGDLTEQGQQQSVQWCQSNCAYTALFPDDPQSPMVPVQCWAPGTLPNTVSFAPLPLLITAPGLPRLGTGGACSQSAGPVRIPQGRGLRETDTLSHLPLMPAHLPGSGTGTRRLPPPPR